MYHSTSDSSFVHDITPSFSSRCHPSGWEFSERPLASPEKLLMLFVLPTGKVMSYFGLVLSLYSLVDLVKGEIYVYSSFTRNST